jgi:histidine triad (HIT) family protein
MTDSNCIFCKIAGGDIPSSTVYEDERFRVILDLSPATKGHALILTKQHYANIFEIDDEVLSDLMLLAKKVAKAMKTTLQCAGVNIVQNNGESAGQTVFHFHMHVIPRYEDDGQQIGWKPGTSDPDEQAELAKKIGNALI